MCWKTRWGRRALFGLVAIGVLGSLVMLLWNAILPALFTGVRPIGYLQALGLLVLSRILFGGFRGGPGGWHRHRHGGHGGPWNALSPQERARFGCGGDGTAAAGEQEGRGA